MPDDTLKIHEVSEKTTNKLGFTVHNCVTRDEAVAGIDAILAYLDHPEYPQHKHIGKSTGGGYKAGAMTFWVWRVTNGWSAELLT